MVKLKERILDPDPHPDDVIVDTIRPICLPDFEADILTNRKSYLYDKEVLNSRLLTAEKARIISYGECKNALSNIGETLQEYVFVCEADLEILMLSVRSSVATLKHVTE